MMVVNARFLTQPLTGVQRYAFEVSMQIRQQEPETVFLTPPGILQTAWAKNLNAIVCGSFGGHAWEQWVLPQFLKQYPGAVLFSPGNTGPITVERQVLTLHDLAFLQPVADQHVLFRQYYRLLMPSLLRRVAHVFTVSEAVRKEIIAQYALSPDKVSVTLNGLPHVFWEEAAPVPRTKVLLAVGNRSPRKRTGYLVRSFLSSGLAGEYTLILAGAGSGPFRREEWPAHPAVQVMDKVSDEQLLRLYREASGLIALSSYEGFGLPVLEALSQQCRVACSDIPVFRELFEPSVHFLPVRHEEETGRALRAWVLSGRHPGVSLNDPRARFSYRRSALHILKTAHTL